MRYLLFMLCLMFSSSYAQTDFRNVKWGMTSNQVFSIEKKNEFIKKNNSILYYETSIAGRKSLLMYHFLNDKLWKLVVYLNVNYYQETCNIDIVQKYNKLKSIFYTFDEKKFKNKCQCVQWRDQRISLNTDSPILPNDKLDFIEQKINQNEKPIYNEIKNNFGYSWAEFKLSNDRSDAFIYVPTTYTEKYRCEFQLNQNTEPMSIMYFEIEASTDIYNEIQRKAF